MLLAEHEQTYVSGTINASSKVKTNPVIPSAAVTMTHDLSVSVSVSPLIFAKIQKPLLFIQSPTSEPLPMAKAR